MVKFEDLFMLKITIMDQIRDRNDSVMCKSVPDESSRFFFDSQNLPVMDASLATPADDSVTEFTLVERKFLRRINI